LLINLLKQVLNRLFNHEDIGWKDIGETFIRYDLLKTPFGNLYLHNLICPTSHLDENGNLLCHDHPWWFITLVLKGGYTEMTSVDRGWIVVGVLKPGALRFRSAKWSHSVTTSEKGMWSLVLTGPKSREWSVHTC
jgi:hypothetical protein